MLIKKAKLLASRLEIPKGTLQFSSRQFHKFKNHNRIHQKKLYGEANSADNTAIIEVLSLLCEKCATYPFERIYNINETELFYQLESDQTLATKHLSKLKKNKKHISVILYSNANRSHKLKPLIIEKNAKL